SSAVSLRSYRSWKTGTFGPHSPLRLASSSCSRDLFTHSPPKNLTLINQKREPHEFLTGKSDLRVFGRNRKEMTMIRKDYRNPKVAIFFAFTLGLIATMISVQNSRGEVVRTSTTFNPLQVALLAWYPANQTTTFATGHAPFGVAFDGA